MVPTQNKLKRCQKWRESCANLVRKDNDYIPYQATVTYDNRVDIVNGRYYYQED